MDEIWKPYREGIYHVSNIGRIKRMAPGINARVGEIKKVGKSSMGYWQFSGFFGGKAKNVYVHRAVAEAFIGEIPDGYEINHKNGIKTDNRVENLEIVTRSQNCIHAIKTGLAIPFKNRKIYRGDDHWTRARPELIKTTGDKNGSRLHPERILRGSMSPSSKLNEAKVIEIRKMHAEGIRHIEIGVKFGVSRENIRFIVDRKTWKHVA